MHYPRKWAHEWGRVGRLHASPGYQQNRRSGSYLSLRSLRRRQAAGLNDCAALLGRATRSASPT